MKMIIIMRAPQAFAPTKGSASVRPYSVSIRSYGEHRPYNEHRSYSRHSPLQQKNRHIK